MYQSFLLRFISLNITKLRLNGFKSFVDPTEFEILPGLTGVVGPNGCGKSNLLDALRWVMGENRPTSMRGDGMDDVIFSGTSLRPARSYAEVNLQVENFDPKILPTKTNESSIEIVRRINFESGSTYKIEGKEILAREVRLLFADYSSGFVGYICPIQVDLMKVCQLMYQSLTMLFSFIFPKFNFIINSK